MDAGVAALLGGLIGATGGALGAMASAHIAGRKIEQQARIQARAQLDQARMQVRASHLQQLLGAREQRHAEYLGCCLQMIDALRSSGLAEPGHLSAADALAAVDQINSRQQAVYYPAVAHALLRGPAEVTRRAFELNEAMHLCMICADEVSVALGLRQDAAEAGAALQDALLATGEAWSAYVAAVQKSLEADGTAGG